MIGDKLRELTRRSITPVAAALARLGVSPNALTIIGFLLNVGVGLVLAAGYVFAGGLFLLFAGLFDTLDGAVARVSRRVTVFGGFLDSTLDRYSEAAVLFGLLVLFAREGRTTEVVLVYAVIVGSLMVSYARARAEGLGLRCDVGLLQRPERIVLLGFGLLLNLAVPVLWVLAVFTNLTTVQRIVHVYRLTKASESSHGGKE